MEHAGRKTHELYNTGITLTNAPIKRMDWFRVGRDLFKGEGLVSAGFRVGRTGFVREGLVSAGFGLFRFLVTTVLICVIKALKQGRSKMCIVLL